MLIRFCLTALLGFPILAQAFYQWQDETTEIEARGLVRGIALMTNNANDDVLFIDDKVTTGGAFGRLMLDVHQVHSSFELHAVQSVIDKELRTGGSRVVIRRDVERSDALHWQFADQHADLVIDRFNWQYSSDKLNIKLGRQPINLASTFYFTPNDFFAPFAAQTFYRTYKPGVDAGKLDWQWSEFSQLSLMAVMDYTIEPTANTGWSSSPDWSETSYLARVSTLLDTFQWALLIGRVNSDAIVGFDMQGELFEWLGVRGEGHLGFPGQQEKHQDAKVSLGFDHRFDNTLTIRVEHFYRRSGANNEDNYSISVQDQITNFYLARNYTALGASYEFTSLLMSDVVWLINHNDSSSLLAFYATYSLSDESELAFSANLTIGDQPSNGVLNSEFGSYPKSLNLEYRLYF